MTRKFIPTPILHAPEEKSASWRDKAACREVDPELFFPTSTKGPGRRQTTEAKKTCRKCPVMTQCLQWALGSFPHPEGIWGGTDEGERADMIRNRHLSAKTPYSRQRA